MNLSPGRSAKLAELKFCRVNEQPHSRKVHETI